MLSNNPYSHCCHNRVIRACLETTDWRPSPSASLRSQTCCLRWGLSLEDLLCPCLSLSSAAGIPGTLPSVPLPPSSLPLLPVGKVPQQPDESAAPHHQSGGLMCVCEKVVKNVGSFLTLTSLSQTAGVRHSQSCRRKSHAGVRHSQSCRVCEGGTCSGLLRYTSLPLGYHETLDTRTNHNSGIGFEHTPQHGFPQQIALTKFN